MSAAATFARVRGGTAMQRDGEAPGAGQGRPIRRRDLRFALDPRRASNWHARGPHVAHWFNALSLFLPPGEAFFIDSVRHFAADLRPPELRAAVADFLAQEAAHSREHRRYNAALAAAGLPARYLEKRVQNFFSWHRQHFSPANRLAVTIALEHFTAVAADVGLRDPATLSASDAEYAALWRWHAREETEHKAVAFDVYQASVAPGWRAYARRVANLLAMTPLFCATLSLFHLALVARSGHLWDGRGWLALLRFLYTRPGVLRGTAPALLRYLRPRFHPWQYDNYRLVGEARTED